MKYMAPLNYWNHRQVSQSIFSDLSNICVLVSHWHQVKPSTCKLQTVRVLIKQSEGI